MTALCIFWWYNDDVGRSLSRCPLWSPACVGGRAFNPWNIPFQCWFVLPNSAVVHQMEQTNVFCFILYSPSLLRFNGYFPGGPVLADTGMSPCWSFLELRMMEVVVTTEADVQSSSQNVTTDKPTPSFLEAGCTSCCPTNSVKALKGKALCSRWCVIICLMVWHCWLDDRKGSRLYNILNQQSTKVLWKTCGGPGLIWKGGWFNNNWKK